MKPVHTWLDHIKEKAARERASSRKSAAQLESERLARLELHKDLVKEINAKLRSK